MDNAQHLYEVSSSSGVRSLSARKMKPQEVKAWEKQADTERGTLLFIKGMLDICAKAHAEASMGKGVI